MKARIPVTNAQKRLIREEARREYEKVREKECEDITRRLLKVMCESLHDVFGFGNGRLMVTLNDITRRLEHMADDECFWEHRDKLVIDKLGLPFERDYTDRGRASSGG